MSELERIRDALNCIPATERDTWLKMGMAIKAETGDAGFVIWDGWAQSADNYDATAARDVWRSIHANGKVTAGTLFHEAKKHGWHCDAHQKPTSADIETRRLDVIKRAEREEAEREAAHREAAEKASSIWNGAGAAPVDHHYLLDKHAKPYGLRALKGLLLVPVRDTAGQLQNLQFIKGDGTKKFLTGGRVSGHYFGIGTPGDTLCIVEG
ncbi:MAG: PriCT-2 domain-containing protein, partial [Gammaproteobacteria bacterium]